MAINNWPIDERPQEKLLARGAAALSDAELLALFIRSGTKTRSAVDIGRDLLVEYGSLRQILTTEEKQLCKTPGLGQVKYVALQAALEIGRRYLNQSLRKQGPLSSPEQASDFLTHQLRDRQQEVFAVIYLNSRHHVIDYQELFIGTLNGANVHPREVVKSVLKANASAVILAHNHPSGVAEPSIADTNVTQKLRKSLALIDVKLLDHLVIGDGEYVSMSDRGLI